MLKPLTPVIASPAPEELLTLEQVRAHLKIDTDTSGSPPTHPDDDLITALITVARESVESYLDGFKLVNRNYEAVFDAFASAMSLQAWPVHEIVSVTYVDQEGVTQTLDDEVYSLDNYGRPAMLHLAWGKSWPAARPVPNSVKVTFSAGNDSQAPCPKAIEQAMLLMIGHLYENRQDETVTQRYELPFGVKALLQPYRLDLGV